MKESFLLAVCLLLATAAHAQESDGAYHNPKTDQMAGVEPDETKPFRRANTIVLHTSDNPQEAYLKMARTLLAAGYGLDKTDKELGFFSTAARPLNKAVSLVIQASVSAEPGGAAVRLRGIYYSVVGGGLAMASNDMRANQVEYRGPLSGDPRLAWDALAAAALYPGARIEYIRQR